MGANDAAEMLEVAKAECLKLERENADLLAEVERLRLALERSQAERAAIWDAGLQWSGPVWDAFVASFDGGMVLSGGVFQEGFQRGYLAALASVPVPTDQPGIPVGWCPRFTETAHSEAAQTAYPNNYGDHSSLGNERERIAFDRGVSHGAVVAQSATTAAVPTDTKELIATKLAEFCPAWSEAMCESLAGSIAAALSSLSPTQQEWEYGALAPNGLDMDVIGVESKVPVLDPPEAVYRRTPAGLWVLAPTDKEDN